MTCLHLYRQVRVRVNRDWSNRPLTVMELTQRASWRGLNLRSEAVTAPPAEAQACFTRSHQETSQHERLRRKHYPLFCVFLY